MVHQVVEEHLVRLARADALALHVEIAYRAYYLYGLRRRIAAHSKPYTLKREAIAQIKLGHQPRIRTVGRIIGRQHIGKEVEYRGGSHNQRHGFWIAPEISQYAEHLGSIARSNGIDKLKTIVLATHAYIALYHLGSHRRALRQKSGELVDFVVQAREVGAYEIAQHLEAFGVGGKPF